MSTGARRNAVLLSGESLIQHLAYMQTVTDRLELDDHEASDLTDAMFSLPLDDSGGSSSNHLGPTRSMDGLAQVVASPHTLLHTCKYQAARQSSNSPRLSSELDRLTMLYIPHERRGMPCDSDSVCETQWNDGVAWSSLEVL